ncbi:MAG TPA: M48 family metalloprotease [Terriglobales bacterium]|nr:M48 family metalloprotease [Terriglobales bacterium]
MFFRKLLISLSLLALLAIPALAQDQSSQTPSAQPQATQPQTPAKDQTTQTQSTQPASGSTAGSTTASTPTPPQNPQASTSSTPTPPADSSSSSGGGSSSGTGTDAAPSGPPPIQEPDESKVKHTGGKDDVDAIGNRGMGKRGLGDWYSLESEIRMGKQYAMQVESSVKLVQDPVVNEYVNRIGQNLVRNSDAQVPFTIKVIDSDEINAFALPGGFFYVNSGLILAADEEAELAGVMAHEISHVCARHGMRQLTRAQWAQIGTIPLIFIGGGIGYGIYEAAGLGLPLTFMKFQRDFEAEADYLGLQYMYKTGYDPQAFISFFEKIQAKEKKKPGAVAKAFASHPQTPDRIEASQKEIATILPARPQYIVSTSEFDDVKARLATIQNRHKVIEEKDGNKPSLRRASTTDKTSGTGSGSSSDDDRPTLKRRDDSPDQTQQQQ